MNPWESKQNLQNEGLKKLNKEKIIPDSYTDDPVRNEFGIIDSRGFLEFQSHRLLAKDRTSSAPKVQPTSNS